MSSQKGGPVHEMLTDPQKKRQSSKNLLTYLWRTILYELNINTRNFEPMVKRYLNDPNSGVRDTTKDRNNHRGNLMKELTNDAITWRVLMKGLRLLEVMEFELVLRVKRRDRISGKEIITEHSVRSANEISYDDEKLDLSNAKVVEGFTSNEPTSTEMSPTPVTDASQGEEKTGSWLKKASEKVNSILRR